MADEQAETIAFLASPQSYGVDQVTSIRTHGAIVFLAGKRAYKLKRSVCYPYMDYSTPERRKAMCWRELEVNQRLAPQLYLGIKDIIRGQSGVLEFASSASDQMVDSVVVMARFDESALLSQICARLAATPALMRQLADVIAEFHSTAEPAVELDFAAVTGAVVDENIALLRQAGSFPRADVALFAEKLRHEFNLRESLLRARSGAGKLRRCHGDLHLNNIVVIDGKPVLFDAIEFNDSFVFIDPLYDVSFLVMDLERISARPLAHALFNRYCEQRPDDEGLSLLPLYLSLRAAIRAHVAVARSAAGDGRAADEAQRCFSLARNFLAPDPPRLLAIGGFSGTGKSTLARLVAPLIGASPGALILRSDVLRKQMFGVSESVRLPPSAYTPEVNARVFAGLEARARAVLESGHSVVMDSVYGRCEERAQIEDVARRAGAMFCGLWLEAPREILIGRLAARQGDASDATAAVLDLQMRGLTPPVHWPKLDANRSPESLARLAAHHLSSNRI